MARILVAANSSWNLQHFRSALITSLIHDGHDIVTVSPDAQDITIEERPLFHRRWRIDRSSIGAVQNAKSFLALFSLIRRERPDFVLSFTIKPNIYGSFACRLLNVRSIPNVSGLGTAFLGTARLRAIVVVLYRAAFRRAHTVFFQNDDDRRLFIAAKIVHPSQAKVIPGSGVDLKRFAPAEHPKELRFLMIARLLGDKGVREFVEAARKVKSTIPKATFALLGDLDPDNRTAISRAELEDWKAEGAIEYLGATSDVRPFIREASAIVLPSYREGLSRTLLEAAAMARPLIATNVPGCREVVHDGITGFLCEPKSSTSLAIAIEKLASASQQERASMGARARMLVEQEFDEAFVIECYRSALN